MHHLILHPDCKPGAIHTVRVACGATPHGCRATFRFEGDISAIAVPAHATPERRDELWKTTCFEIFWQGEGSDAYREFNLSPSSRWAAYDFDDVRVNGRDAPVEAISVSCSHYNHELELTCDIAAQLPVPAKVALNAVVEDAAGTLQFWALAFAPGKPEFHSPACRALAIGDRP